MLWYKRIRESKQSLESNIDNINNLIAKFNNQADQFKGQFPNQEVSSKFPSHLNQHFFQSTTINTTRMRHTSVVAHHPTNKLLQRQTKNV